MPERRRMLILTSDAGLGHRSAARAIAQALKQMHRDRCEVKIVNPLQDRDVPALLKAAQSDYDRVVRESPELYRLGFELADTPAMASLLQTVVAGAVSDSLAELVDAFLPDAVVSTYPSYQGLLDTDVIEVPYVTVVTDLTTIHHSWFHRDVDLCVVPTEEGRRLALAADIPAQAIAVIGIPVDPVLAEPQDRGALRAKLAWEPDLTTILAVGGNRVTHMEATLEAVNHSGFPLQLALVAGNDDELYRRFQDTEWHLPTRIYGFVDNMPELMHASDAILCKAGGLIVSEALAAGLPLLLVDALPGQEAGNAAFVVEHGAGVRLDDRLDVLKTLTHWLEDGGASLREHARHAAELGNARAAIEIAERIWELSRTEEETA